MDAKDLLIKVLKDKYNIPVRLQGAIATSEKYPSDFFTFWNNDTPDARHYDNKPNVYLWDFDLNYYSCNPLLVNDRMAEAINLLKTHGFIMRGKGYDVVSDEPTHTGRGINLQYEETIEEA